VLAVSVTLPPGQNEVGPLAVMVAVGLFVTVTTVGADVAEQLPLLTVTEYEPAVVTVIDFVVFPFDHRYELPVLAVSVTLPPGQNDVGPFAVIVAVGLFVTVTTVGAEVAEQLPLLTVTEYDPAVVTVMDFVVFPFDHR